MVCYSSCEAFPWVRFLGVEGGQRVEGPVTWKSICFIWPYRELFNSIPKHLPRVNLIERSDSRIDMLSIHSFFIRLKEHHNDEIKKNDWVHQSAQQVNYPHLSHDWVWVFGVDRHKRPASHAVLKWVQEVLEGREDWGILELGVGVHSQYWLQWCKEYPRVELDEQKGSKVFAAFSEYHHDFATSFESAYIL